MNSTVWKRLRQGIGWGVFSGFIVLAGCYVVDQQPVLMNKIEQEATPYFQSESFAYQLLNSSHFLAVDLFNLKEANEQESGYLVEDELPYWHYILTHELGEVDYYVVNEDGTKEEGRDFELLKQSMASNTPLSSLSDKYQFIIQFKIGDGEQLQVEKSYGEDVLKLAEQMNRAMDRTYEDESYLKGLTFIYAVPNELDQYSYLKHQLTSYPFEYYLLGSVHYLIGLAVVSMMVVFLIPYRWISQSSVVKKILQVPFELRIVFCGLTVFGAMGAPFLIQLTHQGLLEEWMSWLIEKPQLMVSGINIFCWSSFALVMAIHALYIKEFFKIGWNEFYSKRTLLGKTTQFVKQRVSLERVMNPFKGSNTKSVLTNETIVYKESPLLEVVNERLVAWQESLKSLNEELDTETNPEMAIRLSQLQAEVHEFIQMMEVQDLEVSTVVWSDVLEKSLAKDLELKNQCQLKIQEPQPEVKILAKEVLLELAVTSLFEKIVPHVLEGSRVYLDVEEKEHVLEVFIRCVVIDDELPLDELLQEIKGLIEIQKGSCQFVKEADLLKVILKFEKVMD